MKNLSIDFNNVRFLFERNLSKQEIISIFDIVFIELKLDTINCRYKNKFGSNNINICRENYLCMSGQDMVCYYFKEIYVWEMSFIDNLTAAKFFDRISKIYLWELLKQ